MINSILKRNKADATFNIKADKNVQSKPKEIVTAFNEYFSEVAENLSSIVHVSSFDASSKLIRLNATLAVFYITADELKKSILSFNSKSSS